MKLINLISIGFMASTPAWAMSYSIEVESQTLGHKTVHGSIVVQEGHEGSVTMGDTTIKFTPTPEGKNSVRIQASIFQATRAGIEAVSKPTLVVLLNQAAEMSQKDADGAPIFRLKLTPKANDSTAVP